MKKMLFIMALLLMGAVAAFAQSPTLPYQALVRNGNNRLVQDSTFTIDVEILQGSVVKYSESRTVTTSRNGMVSFYIGSAAGRTSYTGSLNDVSDWSVATFRQTYHLAGGDLVVTDPVNAVPYALQAANGGGGDVTALTNRVNTFNANVCDSVAACLPGNSDLQNAINNVASTYLTTNSYVDQSTVNSTIHDSITNRISSQIHDSIADALTGNVTTSNLCTAISACTDVASLSGDNTFTGDNTFSGDNDFTGGTTTVASGFTLGTTTSSNCGNVAVNACDLLAVFDSIQRTFAQLRNEISGLRDSLNTLPSATAPAFQNLSFSNGSTSVDVTASFDDGGATIEGLTKNTEYYVCVIADNGDKQDTVKATVGVLLPAVPPARTTVPSTTPTSTWAATATIAAAVSRFAACAINVRLNG